MNVDTGKTACEERGRDGVMQSSMDPSNASQLPEAGREALESLPHGPQETNPAHLEIRLPASETVNSCCLWYFVLATLETNIVKSEGCGQPCQTPQLSVGACVHSTCVVVLDWWELSRPHPPRLLLPPDICITSVPLPCPPGLAGEEND